MLSDLLTDADLDAARAFATLLPMAQEIRPETGAAALASQQTVRRGEIRIHHAEDALMTAALHYGAGALGETAAAQAWLEGPTHARIRAGELRRAFVMAGAAVAVAQDGRLDARALGGALPPVGPEPARRMLRALDRMEAPEGVVWRAGAASAHARLQQRALMGGEAQTRLGEALAQGASDGTLHLLRRHGLVLLVRHTARLDAPQILAMRALRAR